jgi:response regulator RpfG family c-di-GMP phosphodiesterase
MQAPLFYRDTPKMTIPSTPALQDPQHPYDLSDALISLTADFYVTGQNYPVLFVDDIPDTLYSLQRMYESDFNVLCASSGEQALALLAQQPADQPICTVFSDQRMPHMCGDELFSLIRERYPLAVRVLMTAYADIQSVISAINTGHIHRYIRKPWEPDEFSQTLREAVATSVLMQRFSKLYRK